MNAPILRYYQIRAVEQVVASWRGGHRAPLVCAPTGSGKTVIAAEVARRCVEARQRVLFLAPRRELVEQAFTKLTACGLSVGIVMAGDPRRMDWASVTVASVDTLLSRKQRSGEYPVLRPDVIIVDEAHLYATRLRAGLLTHWPDARLVGLSATPARKDGRALGMLFDELIEVATVAELVASGHLVRGRYFSISDPDLSKVRIVAGDYHQGQLARVMQDAALVGDAVQTWLARAGGRRTVVFATSIAHSVALAAEFRAYGVAAEHVDAKTPPSEREAIFQRFRGGATQVLTNCTLASYGFDLPELDCVQLCRPTRSLVLYLQMLGRGLRPAPDKSDCLVLDHAGVVRRFGFADRTRRWSLGGRVYALPEAPERERPDPSEEARLRDCPECKVLFAGGQCPECGWHAKPRGHEVETVAGELVELRKRRETEAAKRDFYAQLRAEYERRGKKPSAAAYSFRDKFGHFPPRSWNEDPVIEPGPEARRWVQSRLIAFANRRVTA